MMRDDFGIFIFSHGRAGRVNTVKTLEKSGYTGKWYIVVDDEDDELGDYIAEYGREKIIVFNKDEVAEWIDRGDNFRNKNIVLYARNKSWELAEELGLKYFMQFDDDYTGFYYRFKPNYQYDKKAPKLECLDFLFNEMVKFLEKSGATTVALSQGGDFIGGEESSFADKPRTKRKAMNTFLCSVDNPFYFMGSINEDVTAYVRLQQLGELMFTVNTVSVEQRSTQQSEGGLTEIYLDKGTYVKSFYTILYAPSCVRLTLMGNKYKRIHHLIKWRNAVPQIVDEKYKK